MHFCTGASLPPGALVIIAAPSPLVADLPPTHHPLHPHSPNPPREGVFPGGHPPGLQAGRGRRLGVTPDPEPLPYLALYHDSLLSSIRPFRSIGPAGGPTTSQCGLLGGMPSTTLRVLFCRDGTTGITIQVISPIAISAWLGAYSTMQSLSVYILISGFFNILTKYYQVKERRAFFTPPFHPTISESLPKVVRLPPGFFADLRIRQVDPISTPDFMELKSPREVGVRAVSSYPD